MIFSSVILRRHALVNIERTAWAAELASHRDLAEDPLLADWAPDRPLVVRRPGPAPREGSIAVGLPLPPCLGKLRLSFDIASDAILSVEPPVSLASVRDVAPASWHATIDALLALGMEAAATPRVFGGFAWASLTGLAYIGPASDLDLIWPLTGSIDLILNGLASIEREAPGRLDGEVVRECDGGAVNWRELGTAKRLLVKSIEGVSLESEAEFLGGVRDRS